jgi:TMEM175 potassium channel family protein
MGKGRLEAFSDGVIAIIITIMVLELRPPQEHAEDISALIPLGHAFLGYVLSFIFVGIYWNNHHHMLHAVHRVDGRTLWANLHLLFWLSLIPFVTGWMGETGFAAWPVAVYGFVMLMSGAAYYILTHTLISLHGRQSPLAEAVGEDRKGVLSVVVYAIAIPTAFVNPWIAWGLYVLVAIMWLIPDRRIERTLRNL